MPTRAATVEQRARRAHRAARRAAPTVLLVSDYLKGDRSRCARSIAARSCVASCSDRRRGPAARRPEDSAPRRATPARRSSRRTTTKPKSPRTAAIRTDEEAREAARDFRARAQCDAVLDHARRTGHVAVGRRRRRRRFRRSRAKCPTSPAPATRSSRRWRSRSPPARRWPRPPSLANHAAGIVVGKFGPATLTPEELLDDVQLTIVNQNGV